MKYSFFSIIFERLFDLIAVIIFAVCFFFIKYKYLILSLEGLAFLLLLTKLNFDMSLLKATFIHTTSGLLGALTMLPGGLVFTEAITVSILKLQTIPLDNGIP